MFSSLRSLALLALFMTMLAAVGCKKEPFTEQLAFIVWTGEFIDGGCGWVVSFNATQQYQPWNLPDTYKVDSLPVIVTYKDLKKRPDCLNRTDVHGQIYIHKIESPL